jgi:exonuclease SbcD
MAAKQGLRLLHTSDWHLGNTIGDKDRTREFKAFLDWIRMQIVENAVDVLIIAGDIFDVSSPGSRIQRLYYQFLASLQGTCCHNVVVIAGNHDSPSLLDAPKEVLLALQVHVVGAIDRENLEKEVVVIRDNAEIPLALFVRYLTFAKGIYVLRPWRDGSGCPEMGG